MTNHKINSNQAITKIVILMNVAILLLYLIEDGDFGMSLESMFILFLLLAFSIFVDSRIWVKINEEKITSSGHCDFYHTSSVKIMELVKIKRYRSDFLFGSFGSKIELITDTGDGFRVRESNYSLPKIKEIIELIKKTNPSVELDVQYEYLLNTPLERLSDFKKRKNAIEE